MLLVGGTEIGVRNKQDHERAMCPAGPGTQQLPNKSSGHCFLLPLRVLFMLDSGSPAKQFVPLREERPCSECGRGRTPPPHPPRECAETGQGGLGENSTLGDPGKEKPELTRISSCM